MAEMLTEADVRVWIERFGGDVLNQSGQLDELDAATGDGEHGTNLSQGMTAVLAVLREREFVDIAELLNTVGMTIVNSVGGASGALYGTLFLRLSDIGHGRQELNLAELIEAFGSALDGVMELGSTRPGDKTMVDALHPAFQALSSARNHPLEEALQQAAQASAEGRDATATMVARRGRGTYLGDRSLGHVDAGAASMSMLFQALHAASWTP